MFCHIKNMCWRLPQTDTNTVFNPIPPRRHCYKAYAFPRNFDVNTCSRTAITIAPQRQLAVHMRRRRRVAVFGQHGFLQCEIFWEKTQRNVITTRQCANRIALAYTSQSALQNCCKFMAGSHEKRSEILCFIVHLICWILGQHLAANSWMYCFVV
jgi:hypothetical protein